MPPDGENDPLWTERFKRFWEVQEKKYGIKMSDFTYVYDDDIMIITSFAAVTAVLNGTRI